MTDRLVTAVYFPADADWGCEWLGCDHPPTFRVATPIGAQDFCEQHTDIVVESLPEDWLRRWERVPANPHEHGGEDGN